jgi:hypothetical protein
MKKILGIIFLGLLLSGNSYAGWFSKLPTLKCTVTPSGEPTIVEFLILKNYYTDRGPGSDFQKKKAYDKSYTFVDVKKDTFEVSDFVKEFRGGKAHSSRLIKWYISRKTGELYLTISPKIFYGSGQTAAVLFDVERSANGLCVEAK